MKTAFSIFAVVCSLLPALSLHAIDVEGVLSVLENTHSVAYFNQYESDTEAGISAAGGSVDPLAANFAFLQETEVVFRLRAPKGRVILFDPPPTYNVSFRVFVATSNYDPNGDTEIPSTAEFIRTTGAVPALTPTVHLSGMSGEGIRVLENAMMGAGAGPFTFKELRVTATVPASYNEAVNDSFSAFEIEGYGDETNFNGGLPDPGQWVRLVRDPEVTRLKKKVRKLKSRRRTLNRRGKKAAVKRLQKRIRKLNKRINLL